MATRLAAGQCGKARPFRDRLLFPLLRLSLRKVGSGSTESHRLSALCGGKPQAKLELLIKFAPSGSVGGEPPCESLFPPSTTSGVIVPELFEVFLKALQQACLQFSIPMMTKRRLT